MLHVLSPHVSGGEKFHDLLENGRCGELVLEDFIKYVCN